MSAAQVENVGHARRNQTAIAAQLKKQELYSPVTAVAQHVTPYRSGPCPGWWDARPELPKERRKAPQQDAAVGQDSGRWVTVSEAAATVLQRWWRAFCSSRKRGRTNFPVSLPPAANDDPTWIPWSHEIDTDPAMQTDTFDMFEHLSTAWHTRLGAAGRRLRRTASRSAGVRCVAQLAYCEEVGRFSSACSAAAVMAVHVLLRDPHGQAPESFEYDTAVHRGKERDPKSGREAADRRALGLAIRRQVESLPTRIFPHDQRWKLARPRFAADRVFLHDSILMTIIGGEAAPGTDEEAEWRLYQHDASGLQCLADAVAASDCASPLALPVATVVDYLGFRIYCRPMPASKGAPELVLGPVTQAMTANSAWAKACRSSMLAGHSAGRELSLSLHKWESEHQELCHDLRSVSERIRLRDYPVILDASDLPQTVDTSALLRIAGELHFATPSEVLPPEVEDNMEPADPRKRLRAEALQFLQATKVPSTQRASAAYGGEASDPRQVASGNRLAELGKEVAGTLPKRFLQRVGVEGAPLDSRAWTEAMHGYGLNVRHLSRIAHQSSPAVAAALYREALARTLKWLLRRALWQHWPWATGDKPRSRRFQNGERPEHVAVMEAVRMFNLALGGTDECQQFWDEDLVPEVVRRYRLSAGALNKRDVRPVGLFHAMQYHCGIRFKAGCSDRPFFRLNTPEPLTVMDLSSFNQQGAEQYFSHRSEIERRLLLPLRHMQAQRRFLIPSEQPTGFARIDKDQVEDEEEYFTKAAPLLIGFYPRVKVIAARGYELSAGTSAMGFFASYGRWDRTLEALNLRLSLVRAIGEPPGNVAAVLQAIAVAQSELVKATSTGFTTLQPSGLDRRRADHIIRTAEAANLLVPTPLAVWWSQVAAVEALWSLKMFADAEAKALWLTSRWQKEAKDQPLLQLRLESVCARLLSAEADYAGAMVHLRRCCELSGEAFGRSHPATVATWARLGDVCARQEAWVEAVEAFQTAYLLATSHGDITIQARLAYEYANVLYKKGDPATAEALAERAVDHYMPRLRSLSRHAMSELDQQLALDSLYLLARIAEDIFFRAQELKAERVYPDGVALSLHSQRALVQRAVASYDELFREWVLRSMGTAGRPSQRVLLVLSVVRLKTVMLNAAHRRLLMDAIEGLQIAGKRLREEQMNIRPGLDGQLRTRGVCELPRRPVAKAAAVAVLRTPTAELPERVVKLCAMISRVAAETGTPPSSWFASSLSCLETGSIAGFGNLQDASHMAALQLIDLCRFFISEGVLHLEGVSMGA